MQIFQLRVLLLRDRVSLYRSSGFGVGVSRRPGNVPLLNLEWTLVLSFWLEVIIITCPGSQVLQWFIFETERLHFRVRSGRVGHVVLFGSFSFRHVGLAWAGTPFICLCSAQKINKPSLTNTHIRHRLRNWSSFILTPFWRQEVTSSFFGWPGWWC